MSRFRNRFYFVILLLLELVTCEVISELLLKKGWYKTHKKGPKIVLANVEYIDNETISNPVYLRVNARIHTLSHGSVRNLNNLSILKFPFCVIFEVAPGAFQNLPNLTALGLLDNEIKHVKAGVFNNLTVSTLYLHRNQIEVIDTHAFDDMPNLYKLKLNSNKISVWDSNWFHNSPCLTEILFRRNAIQQIPSNAFKNIRGTHLHNDTFIVDTKIYLSKNNISVVDPNALANLEELSQLWLDRNQISQLDGKVFSQITQLGTLFLSKNRLISLPDDLFPGLSSEVDILDLSANHNLTCLPYSIVSKVKLTNLQYIGKVDCKCVDNLNSKLVKDKKVNEIKTDCEDN